MTKHHGTDSPSTDAPNTDSDSDLSTRPRGLDGESHSGDVAKAKDDALAARPSSGTTTPGDSTNPPPADTPSSTPPPRRKTDEELLADAQKLHAAILMKYDNIFETDPSKHEPEKGDFAHTKLTVATGEFNGELVYTVNGNGTSREMQQIAEDLGYTRIFGKPFTGPGQTHAEQIMLNALEQGRLSPPGAIAPSREYCDNNPNSNTPQNCGDRVSDTPGVYGVPFREVWPP
ncbi:hypothetical protein AB0A73_06230 [Glycomyces sp. NPDC047369]